MKKTQRKMTLALAVAAVLAAVAIAGCGGGGSSSSSSGAGGGSGTEGTIGATEIEGLGSVLVDSEGMTKPTAGEGAMASALGTTKRKDGTLQVTYKGHPLYTFSGDEAPGEANGQESEGTWFALDEAGAAVKGQAEEESSGGAGYSY